MLAQHLAAVGIRLLPAEAFYLELLGTPKPDVFAPEYPAATHLEWLSQTLSESVAERLNNSGRIAQEALGWEKLSIIFSVDPDTDFYSGF